MQNSYRVVAQDRYLKTRFVDDVVVVKHQDTTLIRTDMAIALVEGDRPAVLYVPLDELTGVALVASDTAYPCRWKGDAQYYHVSLPDGSTVVDGAWAYPAAPEEVAVLRTRLAFDPACFSILCGNNAGEHA